jgi:hypothetical protein
MHDPEPDPVLRRAEIARRNGALSRGPATPEGKARSAMNATRHGLCGRSMPEGADGHELADLRAALLARWQPVDAAEAHLVEELVFAAWRQMRLRAVEDAVLARAERGEPASTDLPSLATLIRYRGRIDRDRIRASQALLDLRRRRAEIVDPMRLRWLAERIEHAQAIAAAFPPGADERMAESGTNEPTPTAAAGAAIENCTNEFDIGTNEPTPANCTNELPPGMNEPRYLVPPLPEGWSEAPDVPPRRLNRHQRRRLAALRRLAA